MAYKNNIFKDKTVIALSTISIIAAAALIGGIALDSGSNTDTENQKNIVDLNENDTTLDFARNSGTLDSTEETTTFHEEETTKDEPETTIQTTEVAVNEDEANEATDSEVSVNAPASSFNFTSSDILTWPVDGNIVIDYDMENTVYFPTLDLYKCSDAICIQSEVGTPVYASAQCIVKEVSTSDEIGSYVVVDLGNEYLLTYGQLKDVVVTADTSLEEGDLIGYVNEPSKYYTVEGPNLYLKLTENGIPVNPLDYLNYE